MNGDVALELLRKNFVTSSGVLIRRPSPCGMFDESIIGCSDHDLWMRLICMHQFVHVDEALVLYRCHPQQLHLQTRRLRPGRMRFYEKTLAWMERERPELLPEARVIIADLLQSIARRQLAKEHAPKEALETLHKLRGLRPMNLKIALLFVRAHIANRLGRGADANGHSS